MKEYIKSDSKPKAIRKLINEALYILESIGVPLDNSERRLERMAMCFLSVAGITKNWKDIKDKEDRNPLKTRDIIKVINETFQENISPGSYDDIRRKDLKMLVLADLIINRGVNTGSATNDPTRGYELHPEVRKLILTFKTDLWAESLDSFNKSRHSLSEILARNRDLDKISVTLPNGDPIVLSLGEHNLLQKAIIEEFLPRFGSDCKLLYLGDTSNKKLHIELEELKKLNFFDLSHDELPDIIAYSKKNNWLYLIEAVHSSGPMSEIRVLELKRMLKDCTAELIFVTCLLTKKDFRKWILDIAWETEVWIAESPDHLVHFNGHKFLGAY